MKVHVEIDCTPEEARRLLGLPDLGPMQQAVLAKLQDQLLNASGAASPEALLKQWMPLIPQSPEQLQQAVAGLFRLFTPGGGPSGGGASGPAGGKCGQG